MMRNRPEFHVVDLAATFLRATPVSIYNSSSPEELQYLVDHAEAEIAVVEDVGFLERFLKVRDELPRLRRIFVIEPPATGCPTTWRRTTTLLVGRHRPTSTRSARPPTRRPGHADLHVGHHRSAEGRDDQPAQRRPHVRAADPLLRVRARRRRTASGCGVISYLPMAHIAERISSHYNGMRLGFTVTCCPDPTQIATLRPRGASRR